MVVVDPHNVSRSHEGFEEVGKAFIHALVSSIIALVAFDPVQTMPFR